MSKNNKIVVWLISIVSIAIILATTYAYYFNGYFLKNTDEFLLDTEKLGQFGDFVGGFLGAVLTIVATIFVYNTYISQKNELEQQRSLIAQQQFETRFFNMLELHRSIKNQLKISNVDLITKPYRMGFAAENRSIVVNSGVILDFGEVTGSLVFSKLIEDFERIFNHFPHANPIYNISSEIDDLISREEYGLFGLNNISTDNDSNLLKIKNLKFKYDIFHSQHFRLVGDYLRNVYHILKFLSHKKVEFKKNGIDIDIKSFSDIFQSQMSYSELALIYYNAIKFRKARKLIREFNFIENVHQSNLLFKELIIPSLGKIKTK